MSSWPGLGSLQAWTIGAPNRFAKGALDEVGVVDPGPALLGKPQEHGEGLGIGEQALDGRGVLLLVALGEALDALAGLVDGGT